MRDINRVIHVTLEYLLFAAAAILLGYLMGRTDALSRRVQTLEAGTAPYQRNKPKSWTVQAQSPATGAVTIDERKFVTEVSTAGLEKPAELALGEKQTVADDIDTAASKLAQLKRN